VICAVFAPPLSGQSVFQRGEEFFMQNQPKEAAALLETALNQEPRNEKIYLYLGIVYEQLGNHDKAIAIMQKGLSVAVLHKDILLFNMGNNYYTRGDVEKAVEMYSQALEANGALTGAYLNRANAGVKLTRYEDALRDYRLYLVMEPEASQKIQIGQMIQLLENMQAGRVAEVERQRVAEEERIRTEEETRRVAEERKHLEEERQKVLLEEVLKSLQMSADETSHLSAEKEAIIEDREEVDIDD
ncbi:MAG: tetratricopeptide repeat protein, partial [Spirochaetales bacterium]|jgi:tetratricopeptide (TPR) repeat protein|nr:tetratricopeptide repeat protein [Spirochaetales bacterium]